MVFRPTRRDLIAGAAVAGSTILSRPACALQEPVGLKDYAAQSQLVFGSAISVENFPLPECRALYERETRIVTTDLALKFATLRPSPDVFNFGPADAVIGWARDKGLLVRGHTLIWNESNGDWLKGLSSREIERVFDEHIERVVSRYAGRIHTWDVVNEPFWPDQGEPGGFRRGPWYDAIGPGYVEKALKRVRAIDKTAKLAVNESQLDNERWGRSMRPCFTALVTELRHGGAPLDVAGFESHLEPNLPHDYARFGDYLRAIAALGLDLHVTEFDINDSTLPTAIPVRDAMVAAHAESFLKAVLPIAQLKMFITWELADHWSWLWHAVADKDPLAPRLPRPLPFDDHLRRKPLWYALAKGFDARVVT